MTNQTVIITGSATGLGYAIAESFLDTGANVTLNGRTKSKLENAAQKLNQPNCNQIVVLNNKMRSKLIVKRSP